MSKYKMNFELEENTAYPEHRGHVTIIGKEPKNPPYLAVTFHDKKTGQIAHSWVKDRDLERLAINILRSLNSNKLKGG